MRGLFPIESTHLACLVNTYAVRGRTKVLGGGSRQAARQRSLEGTLVVGRLKDSREWQMTPQYWMQQRLQRREGTVRTHAEGLHRFETSAPPA